MKLRAAILLLLLAPAPLLRAAEPPSYAQRLAAYGWETPQLATLRQAGIIDATLQEKLEQRMTVGDFPGALRIAAKAFPEQRADDHPAAVAIWFRWTVADRDAAVRAAALIQQEKGKLANDREPKAWDGIGTALAISEAPDKIQWLRERLTFTEATCQSGSTLLAGLMTPWTLAGNFDLANLLPCETDEPARVQVMTVGYLSLLEYAHASALEDRSALFRRLAASVWHWRSRDHSFLYCTTPDTLLATELGQASHRIFGADLRPAGVTLPESKGMDPEAMKAWTQAVMNP